MAVDRARQVLYVADWTGHRVRAVDLVTGFITTLAGTGAGASTGDGGLASAAAIWQPEHLLIAGSGLLVREAQTSYVRRIGIDPLAADFGIITSYLRPGWAAANQPGSAQSCSATGPLLFNGFSTNAFGVGSLAVDPLGTVYVAGWLCGGPFGTTSDYGIARVDPATGALQYVAGKATGSAPSPGQALSATKVGGLVKIVFDGAGRLWLAQRSATASANLLAFVAPDGTTKRIESSGTWNLLGQSATPSVPPQNGYAPASGTWFGSVYGMVWDPGGHLYFTDSGEVGAYQSNSVRVIW
jgi:hypothetical protein